MADSARGGHGARSREHGKTRGEHIGEPAFDAPIAGHDAVSINQLLAQPEVRGAVSDKAVELDERTFVEQQIESLSSGELALVMLRFEAGRPPPPLPFCAPLPHAPPFFPRCPIAY